MRDPAVIAVFALRVTAAELASIEAGLPIARPFWPPQRCRGSPSWPPRRTSPSGALTVTSAREVLALQQCRTRGRVLNELALFAGAGGGILGSHLLGMRTVCAVEWDAYAACVLVARQNDGCLPPFPVWDDVRTFDGRPWRGRVDVVSGGFPCQDISAAGKGAGIDGERSGMWAEMARIIGEVRPRHVLVENSPMLTSRGLGRVLGDLAALGYDARWGVLGACDAGAPHRRDRIWVVADSTEVLRDGRGDDARGGMGGQVSEPRDGAGEAPVADADQGGRGRRTGEQRPRGRLEPADGSATGNVPNADRERLKERQPAESGASQHATAECRGWWSAEPDVGRVAHGMAARVDRLACLGNGQVPAVVRLAWQRLTGLR